MRLFNDSTLPVYQPNFPQRLANFPNHLYYLSLFRFAVVGGGSYPPYGALSEYLVLPRDAVIPVPEHMSDEEAGAWGVGAITAWR